MAMAGDASSSPPPPPLLLSPLPLAVVPDRLPPSASLSFTPSLHIIAAIIACVFLACAFIHLLLRFLSSSSSSSFRRPSLSSSVSTASLLLRFRSTPGVAVTSAAADAATSDKVKSALIDSLPIFTLSSSLASLPKSSPDCAVCLRPFRPEENLRLLPACRHAFHSGCVEPWIRNTPSCPLCRTRVTLPPPPLPYPGKPPAGGNDSARSGGVCGEICSDDHAEEESRRNPSPLASLVGSSLDYMVQDEEAAERNPRRAEAISAASGAGLQAEEVGGTPGGGGGSRRWLIMRDYMDRIALSASSSLRLSGRWIQRCEDGGSDRHCADLELEGSARSESTTDAGAGADDDGDLASLYRWIVGV